MAKVKRFIKHAYPLSAQEAVEANYSPKELIAHARNKWQHLYPHVLESYGLVKNDNDIGYYIKNEWITVLVVIDETCSLCKKYRNPVSMYCGRCPIKPSRNSAPCYSKAFDEEESPWTYWTRTGDPAPMIAALDKAMEWVEDNTPKGVR